MAKISEKFTDHNLMLFYGNVLNHYQDCVKRLNDITQIYHEMFIAVQYALESTHGSLCHLNFEEKDKVYKTFNAIFYALPIYQNQPEQLQRSFKPELPKFNPEAQFVTKEYNTYNCHDSFLFDWMLLNAITHNCHHHHYPPMGGFPYHGRWPQNQHGHGSRHDDKNGLAELLALLALLLLAAAAAILTCIAVYYMLNQFLEGIERFCYNEGWLRAALVMANSAVFGAGSTILTTAFAAAPLVSLAIMAGISPVVVVTTAAVLLGVIGAGVGAFTMNLLYGAIERKMNQDAMDPSDPLRFRLTSTEEENLIRHSIDPIMVKCAMVALRAEIAKTLNSQDKEIPSFLSRKFGDGAKVQELLQTVRDLRAGNVSSVKVGALSFECKLIMPYYLPERTEIHPGLPEYVDLQPSAPPYMDQFQHQ